MKKALTIVLSVILCLLSIAVPVSAAGKKTDSSGIKATIKNKNGAKLYECEYEDDESFDLVYTPTGSKIPAKTELFLSYQGEYYAEAQDPDAEGSDKYWEVEYKGETGLVKFSDLSLELNPVTPPKSLEGKTYRRMVVSDSGAAVYEGPSKVFDEVDTIEPGTEIEITVYDEIFAAYVDYDGVSGWIVDYFSDLGSLVKDHEGEDLQGHALTLKKSNLYSSVDCEKKIGTIPTGTELTFDVYCSELGNVKARVEYKGKTGWINMDSNSGDTNIMYDVAGYLMLTAPKGYYFDEDLQPGEEGFEALEVDYQLIPYDWYYTEQLPGDSDDEWDTVFNTWYRIDYSGDYVWLCFSSGEESYPALRSVDSGETRKLAGSKSIPLYDKPESGAKKTGKINPGDEYIFILSRYDYEKEIGWEYVNINGKNLWAKYSGDDFNEVTFEATGRADLSEIEGVPVPHYPDAQEAEEETAEEIILEETKEEKGFLGRLKGKKNATKGLDDEDAGEEPEADANAESAAAKKKSTGGIIAGAAVAAAVIIGVTRARKKKEEEK